jgi:hypothetical protein
MVMGFTTSLDMDGLLRLQLSRRRHLLLWIEFRFFIPLLPPKVGAKVRTPAGVAGAFRSKKSWE